MLEVVIPEDDVWNDYEFDFERDLPPDQREGYMPGYPTGKKKSVVCIHYLRGLCKKEENCEYLHEYNMEKMPECQFFREGECTNPECIFRHVRPEDRMEECLWFTRGFCKHGPRCKRRHIKKPVLCSLYEEGFCPDGPNCKYGHPKFYVQMPTYKTTGAAPSSSASQPSFSSNRAPPSSLPSSSGGPPSASSSGRPGGGGRRGGVVCNRCQEPGHKANVCPNMPVTCYYCGETGHYANRCPSRLSGIGPKLPHPRLLQQPNQPSPMET
ncbi:Cleavage and polyadenylation specificity factor subunit 4 [Balamuthia mandrillaris]